MPKSIDLEIIIQQIASEKAHRPRLAIPSEEVLEKNGFSIEEAPEESNIICQACVAPECPTVRQGGLHLCYQSPPVPLP